MIVTAAVCPGAPFLVDGSAVTLAARLSEVAAACRAAVRGLGDADVILLLSMRPIAPARPAVGSPAACQPAPVSRVLAPGTVLGASGFRRSDGPASSITLAGAAGPPARIPDPAVGTVVGAFLLASGGIGAPTTALEIAGAGADAAAALTGLTTDSSRVGLLVIADGAACHGDAAPGKRNDASDAFDRALAAALDAGDPTGLAMACADRRSANALLATVEPLAALAALTAGHPPERARVLFDGAPAGVGYLVGLWEWS